MDDDGTVRTLAKLALERLGGCEVRALDGGSSTLEEAASFRPDVVVLDVRLQGTDGVALMHAMRSLPELAATPVVFCTALTGAGLGERLVRLGGFDVIFKPFLPRELVNKVRGAAGAGRP